MFSILLMFFWHVCKFYLFPKARRLRRNSLKTIIIYSTSKKLLTFLNIVKFLFSETCEQLNWRWRTNCMFIDLVNPRCNLIYSFSLFYGLLSGLGSLFRMFCCLCFTSAVSNKLYYTGDEPQMLRTWIIFLPQWLAVSPYRYEILDIDTSSAVSNVGIISMSSSIAIKLVKRFVVLNNEKKCIATLNMHWFYVNTLNRY